MLRTFTPGYRLSPFQGEGERGRTGLVGANGITRRVMNTVRLALLVNAQEGCEKYSFVFIIHFFVRPHSDRPERGTVWAAA